MSTKNSNKEGEASIIKKIIMNPIIQNCEICGIQAIIMAYSVTN